MQSWTAITCSCVTLFGLKIWTKFIDNLKRNNLVERPTWTFLVFNTITSHCSWLYLIRYIFIKIFDLIFPRKSMNSKLQHVFSCCINLSDTSGFLCPAIRKSYFVAVSDLCVISARGNCRVNFHHCNQDVLFELLFQESRGDTSRDPVYKPGLTSIPPWISKHIPYKV